ncbi:MULTISPECIES: helix-turn-helix transcriptional regulator [Streptomyces]|uniref:HTH luxR-type domain-containing protein n=1 Tax=Streptomyces pseudovenezuelae TaxID=67350 RepID=A0A101N5T0_9ACTN|nr:MULTISPECIES: LuxR C-terminal-related transcriptional regulator [Streptomyces]KUM87073.1 hypothetical protein AQI94_17065 [Streptomyces pseudovenezuelae]
MTISGDEEGVADSAESLRLRAEDLFRAGRADEAQVLLIRALAEADKEAGTSRAALLERMGRYLDAASTSWTHDYFEQALAELHEDEPFHSRIKVLCSAGFAYVQRGRPDDGMRLLNEAITLTQGAGDVELETTVYTIAAETLMALGSLGESLDCTRRARRAGMDSGHHPLVIRSYFNEARATYLRTGSVSDAMRIRRAGLKCAAGLGQLDTEEGNTLRLALIEDLIEAANWPEAAELLGPEMNSGHGSLNEVEETLVRCWFSTWRGQRPVKVPPFTELVESSSPLHQAYLLSLALAGAARLKDYRSVEELTGRALGHAEGFLAPPSSGLYIIDALASAIEAQSGRRHTVMHPECAPRRLLDVVERVYEETRRHVSARYELTDGVVSQARALVAAPEEAAPHWDHAILVFRRTHACARLVPALLGRAALCEPGDPHAEMLLVEAERIAEWMQAGPYLERIAQLRGTAERSEPSAAVLTGRQLEVVALLADGQTDREIAVRLGLSVRTVNAHVVQILTRLGVRNRAETAAWYYRSGPTRQA